MRREVWRGHPHDAGFNFDAQGQEVWHEYGFALGKYHTPAILFREYAEREAAMGLLIAAGFVCDDEPASPTEEPTDE